MPDCCELCACLNDEYFYCQASGRKPSDKNLTTIRPDWCPLIEVEKLNDDLIKRLRWCASYDPQIVIQDCNEAADVIEVLSMKLHGANAAIAGMQREIERMVINND